MRNTFPLRMRDFMALPLMLFLMAISLIGQGQTVTSDLPDYAPGTTATITGTGFTAGEDILIHVDHYYFLDHIDEEYTANANESGSFEFLYQVGLDEDQEFFILTATGQISEKVATCTFTDAAPFQAKFYSAGLPIGATFDLTIVTGSKNPSGSAAGTSTITAPGPHPENLVPSTPLSFYFQPSVTYQGVNYSLESPQGIVSTTTGANGGNIDYTATYKLACTTPTISATNITGINNTPGQCSASVTFGENITLGGTPTPTVTYTVNSSTITSPHTFAVGSTTVTATTSNNGCGTASTTFTVTVTDNEKPVITAPANIEVNNAPGVCGATVAVGTATATDNCSVGTPVGTRTDALALTDPYPVGITTITWTVSDIHGNAAIAKTQTVTVTDNEDPTITAPEAISVNNDAGNCSAVVASLGSPVTHDNCEVASVSNNHESSNIFPVGETTVVWTVTDIHGHTKTANQVVTVTDNELPVIAKGADITQTADAGKCGATVTVTAARATDNCSVGNPTCVRSDGLALDALYPVGITTITWTVSDIHGNAALAKTQTVTVTDNEDPTITAAADVFVNNDEGLCSASVTLDNPVTHDNCGILSVTNNAPSTFPVGETTVVWTVTDIHGHTKTANQVVTVTDNELPVITKGANITQTADPGVCGAAVTVSAARADDNCGVGTPVGTRTDALALTDSYPVGTTTITWTVSDIHGNAAIAKTQTVTVTDDEDPTITAPEAISVNNDAGNCSALVASLGSPVTDDNCGVKSIVNDHPSTTFPDGTTTVTWTVTDIHGHTAQATQLVTVINTAPDISVSAPLVPSAVNTSVSLNVNFTDNNVVSASIDWGDAFPSTLNKTSNFTESHIYKSAGVYTVNVTVTDACGLSDTENYQYIVVYDPSAGFVTGGGWIESPKGASADFPDAVGKANFGFVSKYEKGKTIPSGNTEFQFKAGNLNFKSTSYDWLVISGSKAQFKGTGTINGTGNYSFVLTATDGDMSASKTSDFFRIKIDNGSDIIYDNQRGSANDAALTTSVAGGSIVIHSNNKSAQITPDASASTFESTLKAYPNPFTDRLNIEFSYATDTKGKLEIYSVTGAKLQTLFDGPVSGGQLYNFEYVPRLVSSQVVFYHLTLDGKTQVGKVLFNERR